jgi:hypothetical protein
VHFAVNADDVSRRIKRQARIERLALRRLLREASADEPDSVPDRQLPQQAGRRSVQRLRFRCCLPEIAIEIE